MNTDFDILIIILCFSFCFPKPVTFKSQLGFFLANQKYKIIKQEVKSSSIPNLSATANSSNVSFVRASKYTQ